MLLILRIGDKEKMNEIKNENEYVTKKEFKKSVRNMNFLLCAVVLCVLYMYFFK